MFTIVTVDETLSERVSTVSAFSPCTNAFSHEVNNDGWPFCKHTPNYEEITFPILFYVYHMITTYNY